MIRELEAPITPGTEDDFKPPKTNVKRGSTSRQTWEIDIQKEWLLTQHQAIGKQVTCDPLEKNATKNTARHCWWMALEKELENRLKELDRRLCRKRRYCATEQKAEVSN